MQKKKTMLTVLLLGAFLFGFAVWGDIRHHRRFSRLSVYSRLVVIITTVLIFGGAGVFAALEWNNPNTIGELTVPQKLMAALFQSVTLRTAGLRPLTRMRCRTCRRQRRIC